MTVRLEHCFVIKGACGDPYEVRAFFQNLKQARAASAAEFPLNVSPALSRRTVRDICKLATPWPGHFRAPCLSANKRDCQSFCYQYLSDILPIGFQNAAGAAKVASPCPFGTRPASAADNRQFQRTGLYEFPQSVCGIHAKPSLVLTFSVADFGSIEPYEADVRLVSINSYRIAVDNAHAGRLYRFRHCRSCQQSQSQKTERDCSQRLSL
jgi:hypothetical protein